MARRFQKNNRRASNSSGNGGASAPWTTVTGLLEEMDDLVMTDDSITMTVTLQDNTIAEFDPKFAAGKKVQVSIASKRVGAVTTQVNKLLEGKHLKKNTFVTLEKCQIKGSGLEAQWMTNFARSVKKNGVDTQVTMFNLPVRVREKGKSQAGREYQIVEVYQTPLAATLIGPGQSETKQRIADYVADLDVDDNKEDEYVQAWLELAKDFDNLTVFEQMGVVFDSYGYDDEFSIHTSRGYNVGLRVIELGEDIAASESYGYSNIFGGYMKVAGEGDQEFDYVPRMFADAIETTLTVRGKDFRVSYEDIIEKGVREALAPIAQDNGEDGITYGNDYIDNLVDYIEFMQSDEAKDQALAGELLFEMIPVAQLSLGGKTLEKGDQIAEPFVLKRKTTGNNGQEYTNKRNVIGMADVKLMARKVENEETGDDEYIESYFLAGVTPHVVFGGYQEDVRLSYKAFSPSQLKTPNTAEFEGLDAQLDTFAKNLAKAYDPRNQNGNDPAPEQEGEAPDPEDEGMSPTGPGGQ